MIVFVGSYSVTSVFSICSSHVSTFNGSREHSSTSALCESREQQSTGIATKYVPMELHLYGRSYLVIFPKLKGRVLKIAEKMKFEL